MKKALITGGARGIGREVARELARRGMHVLLGVRDLARGREAAADMGHGAEAVELDVASPTSIEAGARRLVGPVDLLVHNAGLYQQSPAELWPVNVRGPILLTRALEGKLAADARIVNVTSGLGRLSSQPKKLQERLADPTLTIDDLLALPPAAYGPSKAVLNAFTRLLAEAWPGRVVNSVSPGWVKTEMGGPGAPREIAEGAASILLCCEIAAGGPTGHVFEDGRDIGF
jgi:NAD(P)-dependent dehydrogenase (short-subunit alcohol dehydrogenase family)